MDEKPRYDVFLSYAGKDRDWVSQFSTALTNAGVSNWFDVHDLLPGDRWQDEVENALRESDTLVLILSPDSAQSPTTFFELGAAVADRKRIIPVLSGNMSPDGIPPALRRFQYLEEQSPSEAGKRVAEALKARAASVDEPPRE